MCGAQRALCFLHLAPQRLQGSRVLARVFPVLLLEDLDKVLHDALVDAEPAAARAAWSAARVLWPEAMEAARSYSDNPRAAGAARSGAARMASWRSAQ